MLASMNLRACQSKGRLFITPRQAAWALSGADTPPVWKRPGLQELSDEPHSEVRARYAEVRDLTDGV